MNTLLIVLSLLVCVLTTSTQAAQLRIVAADVPGGISAWPRGQFLSEFETICVDDIPFQFSIICIPRRSFRRRAKSALFIVNGEVVQRDNVRPFLINGDSSSRARPWRNRPANIARISCRFNNGDTAFSTITFRCPSGAPEPSSTPEISSTPEMGTATPEPDMDTPMPSPTAELMTPTPEIESMSPSPSNSRRPRRSRTPSPTPSPSTERPRDSGRPNRPGAITGRGSCVRIPALSSLSRSSGWEVVRNRRNPAASGIIFRRNSRSRRIVPAGNERVLYEFRAPESSVFAITLDMTTRGRVDHNDVWIMFPSGGFTLRKGRSVRSASGWIKAFHNSNGRFTRARSIDFNGHSLSTRITLKKGTKYRIYISGRSTMLLLHNIILFPCSGMNCAEGPFFDRRAIECGRV